MRKRSLFVGACLAALLIFSSAASAEDAAANAVDPDASLPPWLRNAEKDADAIVLPNVTDAAVVPEPAMEKIDSNKEARVAFTNLVIYPDTRVGGQRQQVGIKNMGQNAIDLKGWRVTNKPGNDTGFVFGEEKKCSSKKTILPAKGTIEYLSADSSKFMACTLNFSIAKGDTLSLFDSEGTLKANLKLDFGSSGEYKLAPNGVNYWHIPYSKDRTLMETLDKMGHFKHFTAMLRHFQYDRALAGLGRKRWQSCGATAYYPYYACTTQYDTEYDIYYRNGPFTVLAPTDSAIEKMLQEVGGSYAPALKLEEFMELDEGNMAKQMLQYHVIKGHELTPTYRAPNMTLPYNHLPTHRNNSEIVSFSDTFDRLFIHEDCVEAHTQDEYGCKMQVEWDKCGEDWMNDEGLFSQRDLGYCEVSCGKCECTPDTCHDVPVKNIKAKNGVLYALDHVLDVPKVFPIYVPPPPEPEPEPEPEEPASILNRFPSYEEVGLTRESEDTTQTIEDLIELYLASRRQDRNRVRSREESGGRASRGLVLDGLG
mmetsp:Transcript_3199/g.5388  ORF Transcript_3199/g.5388 Transcript_3199/m.5388 type:complete len:539 (-) Transcript_3199:146-1762(-)